MRLILIICHSSHMISFHDVSVGFKASEPQLHLLNASDFSTAYKCRCTRKGPKIRYKDVQKLEIKPKHPFCQEKMILWVFISALVSRFRHLSYFFTPFLQLSSTSSSSHSFCFFILSFLFFLYLLTFSCPFVSPPAFSSSHSLNCLLHASLPVCAASIRNLCDTLMQQPCSKIP